MLEVMPVTAPQKKDRSESLAWQISLHSFHQYCRLLRIDDRLCGDDWFGVMAPDGSLAVVDQSAIAIGEYISWELLWEPRLQVIYDLVRSMSACRKLSLRDEVYFRHREVELIKLGIKVVEMLNENV